MGQHKTNPVALAAARGELSKGRVMELDTKHTAGVTCKGCNVFILDATDEEQHKHHGWFWCRQCFYLLPEVVEAMRPKVYRHWENFEDE